MPFHEHCRLKTANDYYVDLDKYDQMSRRRKLPDMAVAQCGLSSLDEDEKDIGNRVKHVMKLGSRGILLVFLVDLNTIDSEFTSDLSNLHKT